MDCEKYLNLYFNGNPPDNVKVYFLDVKAYEKKYKEITKKINKVVDYNFIDTIGYCMYDTKENFYHILIRDFGDKVCDSYYALTLFHELAHMETLPYKTGLQINKMKNKKNKRHIISGYNFWIEYIAQYEATNKYQMCVVELGYLKDRQKLRDVIKKLAFNFEDNMYEIVLYMEITGIRIKKIKEETNGLIETLKKIKANANTKESLKNISIKELNEIGIYVDEIIDKIDGEEK
jgi:hypothetical protein